GPQRVQNSITRRIHAQTAGPVDKKSQFRLRICHPASLRSDGGRLRLEWVATLPWTEWQVSRGLGGRLPVDWVAGIRGIRSRVKQPVICPRNVFSTPRATLLAFSQPHLSRVSPDRPIQLPPTVLVAVATVGPGTGAL